MHPRQIAAVSCLALVALAARADYDPKLEAEEAAKRKAAAEEQVRRNAEANRMKREAGAKAKAATAARRPQDDAAMKSMTGKSLSELEKMSEAERQAFAKEMERKYGGAK